MSKCILKCTEIFLILQNNKYIKSTAYYLAFGNTYLATYLPQITHFPFALIYKVEIPKPVNHPLPVH